MAATTVACLCFAATRDAQIWTVAFLAVAVGVGAVWRRRRPVTGCRPGRSAVHLPGRRWWSLTGWGTVSSHRTQQNVADVLYVRVFPYPGRVAWFAAHGMPEQAQIDAVGPVDADRTPGERQGGGFFPTHDPAFAPLERWIDSKGDRHLPASGSSPIPAM